MSEELSIQGALAETTVPDLARSIIRSSETATLAIGLPERHDIIYFREGKIVFAATSDPDFALPEVLLANGELNLRQYELVEESMSAQRRPGSLLCDLGFLQPEELLRAIERQVAMIVTHALSAREGTYTIEFTETFPNEITQLSMNTERLLLDGVQKIEQWSLIHRGIGRMDRVLRQAENADARIYHLDLSDEENHVYGLLYEPQTVESMCERSYLPNFRVCRTAWALLAANLIDEGEGAEVDQQRAAIFDEYELEAEVEKYNSAFQQLYGAVFQERGDFTYEFIDTVVVELSPDVAPYLSGLNLLNEGRVDFDQLLNNVIASGTDDRRGVVHHVLGELLASWILQIRSEFGTTLESHVESVVREMKS